MHRFRVSVRAGLASSQIQSHSYVRLFTATKRHSHSVATRKEIAKPQWSQILPAAAVFNAAQKSKFLSFNRYKAENILTDFWVNGVNRNKILDPKDSLQICHSMYIYPIQLGNDDHTSLQSVNQHSEVFFADIVSENAIQPSDLTMLAQVLLRSPSPPNAPRVPSLGSLGLYLLTSAASLNDTLAIIRLASNSLKISSSTPNMSLEGEAHMKNLRKLAKDGIVEAMILLAQVYTQRGQIETAISFWERAGEAGSGYACSELGKIFLQQPDHAQEAKRAFHKGVELADVDSHLQLAQILIEKTDSSARIKELLHLAAASGSEKAAIQLSSVCTGSDSFIGEEWAALTK